MNKLFIRVFGIVALLSALTSISVIIYAFSHNKITGWTIVNFITVPINLFWFFWFEFVMVKEL